MEAPQPFIAHGVNCQNKMGSGVAKALYSKWHGVKSLYHLLCDHQKANGVQPFEMLGWVQEVTCHNKTIYNCFTQENYGYDGKLYLDYEALRTCFRDLVMNPPNGDLAIPKIGCGLAGGDWEKVKQIINEETADIIDVYVYYL